MISKRGGSPDPQASEGQVRQGQRKDETAMGSGVQMGQSSGCSFRAGDRVKADVSDVGTVTTIRYLRSLKAHNEALRHPYVTIPPVAWGRVRTDLRPLKS